MKIWDPKLANLYEEMYASPREALKLILLKLCIFTGTEFSIIYDFFFCLNEKTGKKVRRLSPRFWHVAM